MEAVSHIVKISVLFIGKYTKFSMCLSSYEPHEFMRGVFCLERFRHILNWIFTVGMILMLIVTIGIDDNATYEAYNQASDLSEGWNVIEADGSRSEGSLPYRFPDGNHLVELVYTLPALSNDDVLLVEGNYNAIYAYIDGKEIYHSLPATFGMLETDLGHYAAIIPLDDAYSGKEIVLRIQERTSGYNTDIKHIYLTTTGQYGFNKFVQNAFALALSIVLLTCAAVSFCVWLVFWKRNGGIPGESYHPLLWISLFSICLGLWISSEIYHVINRRSNTGIHHCHYKYSKKIEYCCHQNRSLR